MKKWKKLLPILLLVFACTGCGGDEDKSDDTSEKNVEVEKSEDVSKEVTGTEKSKTYTLASETEGISIEISVPGNFQDTEYSSESWLALEIPGGDEESSTQLMLYLEADESIDVKESMLEEVNYLMSANTDDWSPIEDVENISAENCEWSYISYRLDGLEGYKMWVELENGTVLAGTIENIGDNPEPVNIDEFIRQIDGTIVTD